MNHYIIYLISNRLSPFLETDKSFSLSFDIHIYLNITVKNTVIVSNKINKTGKQREREKTTGAISQNKT